MTVATGTLPPEFPVEVFLRNSRAFFIRLQDACDRMDLHDLREYTTPQMFAAFSMQMQERDDAVQKTDIIAIDAELTAVVTADNIQIASVHFTGQLRENRGPPANVNAVWYWHKSLRIPGSAWQLAGIQQVTPH